MPPPKPLYVPLLLPAKLSFVLALPDHLLPLLYISRCPRKGHNHVQPLTRCSHILARRAVTLTDVTLPVAVTLPSVPHATSKLI
jgi:hypothetical protein